MKELAWEEAQANVARARSAVAEIDSAIGKLERTRANAQRVLDAAEDQLRKLKAVNRAERSRTSQLEALRAAVATAEEVNHA